MTNLTKEQAKQVITDLLSKTYKRLKQELDGENEEFLDRTVRQYRAKVARYSWKASQQWCKWNDDGPVLMPDYTRIYYRKGNTEITLHELPPQIRLLKFRGSLANRENSDDKIQEGDMDKINHYSLALPYVVFIFKYVNGLFTDVRCAFSDRPLKRLEETPLRPYLSNIDSNLSVCLGMSFPRHELVQDNLTQQSALVLSHFWHSSFSDDWSGHYWCSKTHFKANDHRMNSLSAWQEASTENPLFVVEDVNWLRHSDGNSEMNFGDIIVSMLEDDVQNRQFNEELYNSLIEDFLKDVQKTFGENLDAIEGKTIDAIKDELADELIARLQ